MSARAWSRVPDAVNMPDNGDIMLPDGHYRLDATRDYHRQDDDDDVEGIWQI